jgi:hypothetical protein
VISECLLCVNKKTEMENTENVNKVETSKDNVIEISLEDFRFLCDGLPDPYKWQNEIGKYIKNGVDDTTYYYCSQGGILFGFKLRHVNENAIEWRPIQKILISNSDDESFKPCKLIFARHSDGGLWTKDEIDTYNNNRNKEFNSKGI